MTNIFALNEPKLATDKPQFEIIKGRLVMEHTGGTFSMALVDIKTVKMFPASIELVSSNPSVESVKIISHDAHAALVNGIVLEEQYNVYLLRLAHSLIMALLSAVTGKKRRVCRK